MGVMTKLFERAVERVRELPAEEQDALANALLSITGEATDCRPPRCRNARRRRRGTAPSGARGIRPGRHRGRSGRAPRDMRVRYSLRAFADRETIFKIPVQAQPAGGARRKACDREGHSRPRVVSAPGPGNG